MALFSRKKTVVDKERSKAIPFNIETWHYKRFNGELLDIDTIVACIDALARNLAKMELAAIRRDKNNISITEHTSDVAKVLKKPNPYMSQYDFIYKVAATYFSSNNAFIWPEYDKDGMLINLWPINYRYVKMYEKDAITTIHISGSDIDESEPSPKYPVPPFRFVMQSTVLSVTAIDVSISIIME